MTEPDWDELRGAAVTAMGRAYAPYSQFPVGAAALAIDGGRSRIVTGCNVENASYGLGLCAECGLVSALAASGGGRLLAMVCVDGRGALLMPCGRCRQLLFEHGGAAMLVATEQGPITMAELLPHAFGPDDLSAVRDQPGRPDSPGSSAGGRHPGGSSVGGTSTAGDSSIGDG